MSFMKSERTRLLVSRCLGLVTVALGLSYISWRYAASLNKAALWFAIPMVIAETYGIIQMLLFVLMTWRRPERKSPSPPESASVDVFITTYNEELGLVRMTAEAALRIDWPGKKVYILDDGARPAMAGMAREIGCGYISRGAEWAGKPRHAKAGNVNNALLETSGDFILILDADQIPAPGILKATLGYFGDPKLAFVQTPQFFYNLPPGDPFGNDASLFYGPIQQGKDGWNAAFFCGSNAVLRREALMQLGLRDYVAAMEERERKTIRDLAKSLRKASCEDEGSCEALARLLAGLRKASQALDRKEPLEKVSDMVNEAVADAQVLLSEKDMADIAGEMKALALEGDYGAAAVYRHIMGNFDSLAKKVPPASLEGLGIREQSLKDLNLARDDEALPVQALATISVTEDMATAMRLHALGWKSVFHPEVLAYGLAPEDLGSSLKQRLRWAQGTIQVLQRDNPLFKKGLSLPQRLMYLSTMTSYFSGFFNLILILSPIVYFFTRVSPVAAWSLEFFLRFLPFFLMNKLMFRFQARGRPVRRGEQYELAMFPLFIKAVVSVFAGTKLSFVVTPKSRQDGVDFRLILPQLAVILLGVVAAGFGAVAYFLGTGLDTLGFLVNIFWDCYNIAALSVVIKAAFYKTPEGRISMPPAFLFDGKEKKAP